MRTRSPIKHSFSVDHVLAMALDSNAGQVTLSTTATTTVPPTCPASHTPNQAAGPAVGPAAVKSTGGAVSPASTGQGHQLDPRIRWTMNGALPYSWFKQSFTLRGLGAASRPFSSLRAASVLNQEARCFSFSLTTTFIGEILFVSRSWTWWLSPIFPVKPRDATTVPRAPATD